MKNLSSLGFQIAGIFIFATLSDWRSIAYTSMSAAVAIFLATLEIQKGFYEIEFYNSIQGWVFTTVYQLWKSAWKNACWGGTYVTQTGSNKGGQSKIGNFKQTYFLNASYISCTVVVFCYYCTWTQFQFWFQST